MSHDPNAPFDQTVLDLIEHSPVGAVPNTPMHQDALRRLHAAHQVYVHADHKDGHVTARSLRRLPCFHATNLDAAAAGSIAATSLEPNSSIFTRYVQSLPAALQARASGFRETIAAPPAHHRAKASAVHDPLHTLLLVPGCGPHHGLPGNYLHGAILELGPDAWAVHVHDCDDGAAMFDVPTFAGAVTVLHDVVGCAPFHLEELAALGFRLN